METMTNTFPGLPNHSPAPPPRRDDVTETSQTVAAGQLRALIERIERLEEEKRAMSEDIKEIYAEAKGTGYEPKIIRKLVSIRRKKAEAVKEEAELLSIYADALGMQGTLFP